MYFLRLNSFFFFCPCTRMFRNDCGHRNALHVVYGGVADVIGRLGQLLKQLLCQRSVDVYL